MAFSKDLVFAMSQMSDSKETPHTPPRPQAEIQMNKYDSDGFTEVHTVWVTSVASYGTSHILPLFGDTSLVFR